jgi:hypothetical protein
MLCANGVYGECVINNTIRPALRGNLSLQGLGDAGTCADPCSIYCASFNDTPTGLDAGGGLATSDAGVSVVTGPLVVSAPACSGGPPQGTCSHSICSAGLGLTTGCDSCVTTVCAANPSCCGSGGVWNGACIAQANALCNVECATNGTGQCIVCYRDSIDHDGDGYSFAQGDCKDCDPNVNPGAFDFPGNGFDENCNGQIDEAATVCDNGLPFASTVGADYAKAIGLCQFTTSGASGASKTWGVLTDGANAPALVQADGTSVPHATSAAIMTNFGPNNGPREGNTLAVFSSGSARRPTDPAYAAPNGSGLNQNKACAYPAGFPKNKTGCPIAGGQAFDSSGMKVRIRVPTNAQSFAFNFHFLSAEYPEWVCDSYNDSFVALLTGVLPQNPVNSKNISFDFSNNPVNVNIGLFVAPGGPNIFTHPALTGTGFDGNCGGQVCGGSTNWLTTTAPVQPGETITMQFNVWDTGDHAWDSTVLIDNWKWSALPATIQTLPSVPPPVATYNPATFDRDYDATGLCPPGTLVRWGLWSWQAVTPGDSKVSFSLRAATTQAGLASATDIPLLFSSPPGPSAVVGQPAIAKVSPVDTRSGSALTDATLVPVGKRNTPHLRVRSLLSPTSNNLAAPTLSSWNLQVNCVPSE